MFDNFDISAFAASHWPFLVVALLLGIVGEVMKKIVAPRGFVGLKGWRWWWMITLPLHAPAIGFFLGLLPWLPCDPAICSSPVMHGLYYGAAGAFSSYVYAGAKHVAREKLGVGESIVPPAA